MRGLLIRHIVPAVLELDLGQFVSHEDFYDFVHFLQVFLYPVHVIQVYELVNTCHGASMKIAQLH